MSIRTQSRSSIGAENACPTIAQSPPSSNLVTPPNLKWLSATEAIEFLHRGEESVVTFHRKDHGQWQELGGIVLCNLRETLPTIFPHLLSDSYFSINSFYPRTYLKSVAPLTGRPFL